jgi:hypothetical protein
MSKAVARALVRLLTEHKLLTTRYQTQINEMIGLPLPVLVSFGDDMDGCVLSIRFLRTDVFIDILEETYDPDINNDEPKLLSYELYGYPTAKDFCSGNNRRALQIS